MVKRLISLSDVASLCTVCQWAHANSVCVGGGRALNSFGKAKRGNASSVPELGENWSRVNVSELRQMRYQIGGQECDNQGIGEGKIASEWNHKPDQKWGFADPWPSVSELRILSNEIYAVKQLGDQSARLQARWEQSASRRTRRSQWISHVV